MKTPSTRSSRTATKYQIDGANGIVGADDADGVAGVIDGVDGAAGANGVDGVTDGVATKLLLSTKCRR